jgi:hypothetical protein
MLVIRGLKRIDQIGLGLCKFDNDFRLTTLHINSGKQYAASRLPIPQSDNGALSGSTALCKIWAACDSRYPEGTEENRCR